MTDNGNHSNTRAADVSHDLGTYLLLIHDLLNEKGYVRGVELAERLQISRPTVTRAMQRLASLGLAKYERYRGITLTAEGIEQARQGRRRYEVVERFLRATGVQVEDLQLQARRLEGFCTDDVLSAFEEAANRLAG